MGLPPSSCSKTPAPLQVRAGGTVSQTAPALLKQAGGMLGLGAVAVGPRPSKEAERVLLSVQVGETVLVRLATGSRFHERIRETGEL